MSGFAQRRHEAGMVEDMCERVGIPYALGRVILSMARTTLGVTADGGTDMVAVARAIKYTSDNRHLLKRPTRSYPVTRRTN